MVLLRANITEKSSNGAKVILLCWVENPGDLSFNHEPSILLANMRLVLFYTSRSEAWLVSNSSGPWNSRRDITLCVASIWIWLLKLKSRSISEQTGNTKTKWTGRRQLCLRSMTLLSKVIMLKGQCRLHYWPIPFWSSALLFGKAEEHINVLKSAPPKDSSALEVASWISWHKQNLVEQSGYCVYRHKMN